MHISRMCELFFLKHTFVKISKKMPFCHIYIASFAHERIRHMAIYFARLLNWFDLECMFCHRNKISGKVHDHVSMCERSKLHATK